MPLYSKREPSSQMDFSLLRASSDCTISSNADRETVLDSLNAYTQIISTAIQQRDTAMDKLTTKRHEFDQNSIDALLDEYWYNWRVADKYLRKANRTHALLRGHSRLLRVTEQNYMYLPECLDGSASGEEERFEIPPTEDQSYAESKPQDEDIPPATYDPHHDGEYGWEYTGWLLGPRAGQSGIEEQTQEPSYYYYHYESSYHESLGFDSSYYEVPSQGDVGHAHCTILYRTFVIASPSP